MAKRRPSGDGMVRKREDGRWEGRIVVGHKKNGTPIFQHAYAHTQKELTEKLHQNIERYQDVELTEDSRMTLGEWLDIWAANYLGACKPRTKQIYESDIRVHIKPALGAVRMENLMPHTVQTFYNALASDKADKPGLSAKTIKNIHGVLHQALKQAVLNGYIRTNPSDACTLPRGQKAEIKPLDEDIILKAARECGKIVTAEEHNVIGGLGEAVCAVLSEKLPTPVRRVGVQDKFGCSGPAWDLLKLYGLDAATICKTAHEMLG